MATENFESNEIDLFDDTPVKSEDEETEDTSKEEVEDTETEEVEKSEETGEEDEEPPSSEEKDEEAEKAKKSEKMIPESRLKAAIKDVNSQLEEARQELAQLKAKPAPNRDEDPDGYELHNRIEISKQIMRDAYPDYNDKIAKYQQMVKDNPSLNVAVAAHPNPAKYAYDIAKKAIEIEELTALRDSPDWKKFQEWKKEQKAAEERAEKVDKALEASTNEKPTSRKPPNLNRATDVSRSVKKSSDDDVLFKDAVLDKF